MSCNLSVAITWRNSENIRICKGEKYAISWQNHEDHFFNKYRLPKILCFSFCLFFAHFALVFLPSCALKDRNLNNREKKKHRLPQFFAFFLPLGHPCSRGTSIQGTLNLISEKSSHNICSCYLYWRDNSFQRKRALFLGLKLKFNLHSIKGHAKYDWPQRDLITCKFVTKQNEIYI